MNSEPSSHNSNNIHTSLTDKLAEETSQQSPPSASFSPQFSDPENSEEDALARAQTLMIEHEPDQMDASADYRSPLDGVPRYYVQGVIQGQRASLITNLLGGESQTLLQPQMVWTIGRNRDAALPLRDRVLSRRHAVILYTPGEGFYLIDLNSMNGSFVNGRRVFHRQLLQDGDRLRIGTIEFRFFNSLRTRSIEPIHAEILARFTHFQPYSEESMDFSALEVPEILFGSQRE